MNKLLKKSLILAGALVLVLSLAAPAFAAGAPAGGEDPAQSESVEDSTIGLKAIAAGIAVGVAAAGGAVGMGQVHREHRPPARGGGQSAYHPDAGPGVH